MKNLFILLFSTLSAVSCKAQNPIIALFEGSKSPRTMNAYYKDTYGDFDRLVGTWKYSNGTEEFTIILKKKEMNLYNESLPMVYYTDYLYGEFKYIDNTGTTLINTLANIDNAAIE